MSIALFAALLLAPLPTAGDPFTSPPPPIAGREGVGDDIREHLYRLHQDVVSAEASGAIGAAAARDLHLGVERIRRQMFRMGNVVGPRQRSRLRARIDSVRARLGASRA